jgi:hypothetical protein
MLTQQPYITIFHSGFNIAKVLDLIIFVRVFGLITITLDYDFINFSNIKYCIGYDDFIGKRKIFEFNFQQTIVIFSFFGYAVIG